MLKKINVLLILWIFAFGIKSNAMVWTSNENAPSLTYWNGTPYIRLDPLTLSDLNLTFHFDPIEGLTILPTHGLTHMPKSPRPTIGMPYLSPMPTRVRLGASDQKILALYGSGAVYVPYNLSLLSNALGLRTENGILTTHKDTTLPQTHNTYTTLPKGHFIRNQGSANTCWALSANAMLELFIAKAYGQLPSFSVEDLLENSPIPVTAFSGGNFQIASAYYLNHLGPVAEGKPSPFKVTGYRVIHTIDEMKNHVHSYGGAVTSIHYNPVDPIFYNAKTFAYVNPSPFNPMTHDVLIVGWDDYFPKESFNHSPKNNGAFIAQNSFGNDWGDGGLFYISYEDPHLLANAHGITAVTQLEDNTKLYFHNTYGVTHFDGFPGHTKAFGRVHFQASKEASVYGIGLYSGDYNTNVDVVMNGKYLFSKALEYPGYHYVEIPIPMTIPSGASFSIAAYYSGKTPFLIPLQAPYPGMHYELYAKPGQSFIGIPGDDDMTLDVVRFRENATIALRVYAKE